jgi:hypothetical protein
LIIEHFRLGGEITITRHSPVTGRCPALPLYDAPCVQSESSRRMAFADQYLVFERRKVEARSEKYYRQSNGHVKQVEPKNGMETT